MERPLRRESEPPEAARDEAPPAPQSRFRASKPMSEEGIEECLKASRWGVLATLDRGRPYAVPLIFGWDGIALYFVASPGLKVESLEANPEVCFTVTEVKEGGHRWRSVVIRGTAELVRSIPGKFAALRALRTHLTVSPSEVTLADVAAVAHARVIRVRPAEITGRRTRWAE